MTQHAPRSPALREIGRVGSNLDDSLDRDIEARLVSEPACASYAAWEWAGVVWHDATGWHMEVWRHRSHYDTVHADTLDALRDAARAEFGSD